MGNINNVNKILVLGGSSLTNPLTRMVPNAVCTEFTSEVNTLSQRGRQLNEAIIKISPSKIVIFGDGVAEARHVAPGLTNELPIILVNAFTASQIVGGLEFTIQNDLENCKAAKSLLQMYRDLHNNASGLGMVRSLQNMFLMKHIVPTMWGNVLKESNLPSAPLLEEFLNYSGGNYVPGNTTIVYTKSVLVQGAQKLANRQPDRWLEDMSYLPSQRSLQSALN